MYKNETLAQVLFCKLREISLENRWFLVKVQVVQGIFEEVFLVYRTSYTTLLITTPPKGWEGRLNELSNHIYKYFILLLIRII